VSSNTNALWGQGPYGAGLWGSPPIFSLTTGYYVNLLTSEYANAVNLQAFANLILGIANDITNCLATFITSFDLTEAVGAQLDTLGTIVGAKRTVGFQPTNNVSPILDDATYRILIQATIFNNQWDGRLGSLQAFWVSLFPGGSIAIDDHMDMTATVIASGSFSSIILDLITNGYLVPRPQAVQYSFEYNTLPYFGLDRNDGFVAGLDVGHLT
jgi:hypothetical protein